MHLPKRNQLQVRIRDLERHNARLKLVLHKTKRAKLSVVRRLRSREMTVPRLIDLLLDNRELRIKEHQLFLFMLRFAIGRISLDKLKQHLGDKLPTEQLATLYSRMTGDSLHKRIRALIIIFHLYGIPRDSIAEGLWLYRKTIKNYVRRYQRGGVDAVFPRQERVVRWSNPKYKEALFSILHIPPKDYGFNRTTWRQKDLAVVMARQGMPIGKNRVSSFIREAGYRYMKARTVLTSNDPHYREKVAHIHQILSRLKDSDDFSRLMNLGRLQSSSKVVVGLLVQVNIQQFLNFKSPKAD